MKRSMVVPADRTSFAGLTHLFENTEHVETEPEALEILDAIARHGSFGRAAEELGRAPSITYAVRKLEDDLDTLIFDRSGYRAELTPTGRCCWSRAGAAAAGRPAAIADRAGRQRLGAGADHRLDAILPWRWLQPHVEAVFPRKLPGETAHQ